LFCSVQSHSFCGNYTKCNENTTCWAGSLLLYTLQQMPIPITMQHSILIHSQPISYLYGRFWSLCFSCASTLSCYQHRAAVSHNH
jgi:hypothetical protein